MSAAAAELAEAMTKHALKLRATGHSLTQVAEITGIPRGTVYYRLKQEGQPRKAMGRRPVLDASEQERICKWTAADGVTKPSEYKKRIKAEFGKEVSTNTLRRVLERGAAAGATTSGEQGGSGGVQSSAAPASSEKELKSSKRKLASLVADVMTERAVSMRAAGMSLTEVSEATGVPRGTIYDRMRHLGRPRKARGRRPALDAMEQASLRAWAAKEGEKKLSEYKKRVKAEFGKDVCTRTLQRILEKKGGEDAASSSASGPSGDALAGAAAVAQPVVEVPVPAAAAVPAAVPAPCEAITAVPPEPELREPGEQALPLEVVAPLTQLGAADSL